MNWSTLIEQAKRLNWKNAGFRFWCILTIMWEMYVIGWMAINKVVLSAVFALTWPLFFLIAVILILKVVQWIVYGFKEEKSFGLNIVERLWDICSYKNTYMLLKNKYIRISISLVVAICASFLFYKIIDLTSWTISNQYLVNEEDGNMSVFHLPIFAMPILLYFAIYSIWSDKEISRFSWKVCIGLACYILVIAFLDLVTNYSIYNKDISVFSLLLLIALYSVSALLIVSYVCARLGILPGYNNTEIKDKNLSVQEEQVAFILNDYKKPSNGFENDAYQAALELISLHGEAAARQIIELRYGDDINSDEDRQYWTEVRRAYKSILNWPNPPMVDP